MKKRIVSFGLAALITVSAFAMTSCDLDSVFGDLNGSVDVSDLTDESGNLKDDIKDEIKENIAAKMSAWELYDKARTLIEESPAIELRRTLSADGAYEGLYCKMADNGVHYVTEEKEKDDIDTDRNECWAFKDVAYVINASGEKWMYTGDRAREMYDGVKLDPKYLYMSFTEADFSDVEVKVIDDGVELNFRSTPTHLSLGIVPKPCDFVITFGLDGTIRSIVCEIEDFSPDFEENLIDKIEFLSFDPDMKVDSPADADTYELYVDSSDTAYPYPDEDGKVELPEIQYPDTSRPDYGDKDEGNTGVAASMSEKDSYSYYRKLCSYMRHSAKSYSMHYRSSVDDANILYDLDYKGNEFIRYSTATDSAMYYYINGSYYDGNYTMLTSAVDIRIARAALARAEGYMESVLPDKVPEIDEIKIVSGRIDGNKISLTVVHNGVELTYKFTTDFENVDITAVSDDMKLSCDFSQVNTGNFDLTKEFNEYFGYEEKDDATDKDHGVGYDRADTDSPTFTYDPETGKYITGGVASIAPTTPDAYEKYYTDITVPSVTVPSTDYIIVGGTSTDDKLLESSIEKWRNDEIDGVYHTKDADGNLIVYEYTFADNTAE